MLKILFLGLLLFSFAFSQAQTYQSRVTQTICTEVTFKKVGGKVTYTFKEIPNQKNIRTQLINLTDIPFKDNVLTIPSSKSVWFIPFGLDVPPFRVGGAAGQFECWLYHCHCGFPSGGAGGCEVSTTNNGKSCTEAGCSQCCVGYQSRISCITKNEEGTLQGGGIFIVADDVVLE
jgi:hypothetical protein